MAEDVGKTHLDVYDDLPPQLRKLLADGPYQYSPVDMAVFYQKLLATGMTHDEIIDTITAKWRDMERRSVKFETQNLYGLDHPQATKWMEFKTVRRTRLARYR